MKGLPKRSKMKFSINMAVLKNLQNGIIPKRERITAPEYPKWDSKAGFLFQKKSTEIFYRDWSDWLARGCITSPCMFLSSGQTGLAVLP